MGFFFFLGLSIFTITCVLAFRFLFGGGILITRDERGKVTHITVD